MNSTWQHKTPEGWLCRSIKVHHSCHDFEILDERGGVISRGVGYASQRRAREECLRRLEEARAYRMSRGVGLAREKQEAIR